MKWIKLAVTFLRPPSMADNKSVSASKHYLGIDVLRGLSAIVILIWHYQHFYFISPVLPGSPDNSIDRTVQPLYSVLSPIYEHGYWAVQLFWIISGVVFAKVYSGKSPSAKEFVVSRFARLYPLHFITLIFIAVLQFASIRVSGGYQVVPFNDVYHFILNIFFVSHWSFQSGESFNSPIWSVSVEIMIYIVFFFCASRIFSAGILLPLLFVFCSYFIVSIGTRLWFFAMCAMFFFIGVLIYYLMIRFHQRKRLVLFLCVASLIHFAGMYFRGALIEKPFTSTEGFLLVPLVVVFMQMDLSGKFEQFFRKIRWLGNTTYSTYLWHFPIQVMILIIVYSLDIDRGFLNSPITMLVWLGIMLFVGHLSFIYIERPSQYAILNKFKPR